MPSLDQGNEQPQLAMLVTHAKFAAASHKLEAPVRTVPSITSAAKHVLGSLKGKYRARSINNS